MKAWKALLEVFYRPSGLFRELLSLDGYPLWVVPMMLNVVLSLALAWMIPHYVGREHAIRQGAQASKMDARQTERLVQQLTAPGNVEAGYKFLAVEVALFHVILAGALFAFGLMTAEPPEFGPLLAMVGLCLFPYELVLTGGTWLVLATAPDPRALNSLNLLPTSPAAFLDPNSLGKGIHSLLGSIDGLVFADIGLLSLGFSRLTKSGILTGLGAVGGLWIFFLSVKTVISLMF
jgi:hypothetical protein